MDLSKAFDTVLKSSVMKALIRKGVPDDVRNLINDVYTNASTTITNGKGSSRNILINSGVKQGFPLSHFLLNLVMDVLLDDIEAMGIGAKTGHETPIKTGVPSPYRQCSSDYFIPSWLNVC